MDFNNVMYFFMQLEKKIGKIEEKIDLLASKFDSEIIVKTVTSQIGEIKSEIEKFSSSDSHTFSANMGTQKYEVTEKSKNIVIYGLELKTEIFEQASEKVISIFELLKVKQDFKIIKCIAGTSKLRSVCVIELKSLGQKREIFRNCYRLKNLNLKISICDDLSFSERNLRNIIFRNTQKISGDVEGKVKRTRSNKAYKQQYIAKGDNNTDEYSDNDSHGYYDGSDIEWDQENTLSIEHSMDDIKVEPPQLTIENENEVAAFVRSSKEEKNLEPIAHSSTKPIDKEAAKPVDFEQHVSILLRRATENIKLKHKGDEKNVQRALKKLADWRNLKKETLQTYTKRNPDKKYYCICEDFNNILCVPAKTIEKLGINHRVFVSIVDEIFQVINTCKEELQIKKEDNCMCIRVQAEQYILQTLNDGQEDKKCRIN